MKKTKLNEIILRLIIGIILIALLIGGIFEIIRLNEDLSFHQGVEMNIFKALTAYLYLNYFVGAILFLFALTGYFIPNVIGWVLINSLFYFKAFDIFFIRIPMFSGGLTDYLAILIPTGLILIMNLKALRLKYMVRNEKLLTANLIAVLTGLFFVFLKGYFYVNHRFDIFDAVNLVK